MRFSKDEEVIALKKKALDIRNYCLSNYGCNDCCFLKGKSCMINTNPRGWKEDWSADEKRNCSQCQYHYDIIDPKTNRWQAYFCNKQDKIDSLQGVEEVCKYCGSKININKMLGVE